MENTLKIWLNFIEMPNKVKRSENLALKSKGSRHFRKLKLIYLTNITAMDKAC
jgi:hypothetical protein